MDKNILRNYLNNRCTDNEFDDFCRWVESGSDQDDIRLTAFEHWRTLSPDETDAKTERYHALLDTIHHKINLKDSRKGEAGKMTVVYRWLNRVAAVLVIPLFVTIIYLLAAGDFSSWKGVANATDSLEVVAPPGSQKVVQLADGSNITLNYGSKLVYPRQFASGIREVRLCGEAYFDVAHNPQKRFVVNTPKLSVTAVGTKFTVQAYPDNELVNTTLIEGKVFVATIAAGRKYKQLGAMVPGQHIVYDSKADRVTSTKGDIGKYLAWTDGKMVFDNTPIRKVAQELSRKFNVDIEVDKSISDLSYTVTFGNDPLVSILDLMTEMSPVDYVRVTQTKLSDGTFSKLRIRLHRK